MSRERPDWADLLGPQIGWLTVCGFRPNGAPECRKSAKWHLWLAEGHGYTSACDEHVAEARAILELLDAHEWGVWCNLPGSIWRTEPPLSWCEQEREDRLKAFERERAQQPYEPEFVNCC
jgi:hypothetical protein